MSKEVLECAISLIKLGQLQQGIDKLEAVVLQVRPPNKLYYFANIWLIYAYRENSQLPTAIRLCRQLATSSHPKVRVWAQETLPVLRQSGSLSGRVKGLKRLVN